MIIDKPFISLLTSAANGVIDKEYRHIIQFLLMETKQGEQLKIALHYHTVKKFPRRHPDPVKTTMTAMKCSRSKVFRSYSKYKDAINQVPNIENEFNNNVIKLIQEVRK